MALFDKTKNNTYERKIKILRDKTNFNLKGEKILNLYSSLGNEDLFFQVANIIVDNDQLSKKNEDRFLIVLKNFIDMHSYITESDTYLRVVKLLTQCPDILITDIIPKISYTFTNQEIIYKVLLYLFNLLKSKDNSINIDDFSNIEAAFSYLIAARKYYVDDQSLFAAFISYIETLGVNKLKYADKEEIDKIKNKRIDFVMSNILEVSPEYLIKIRDEIINSSYFKKFDVEKDGFWLFINDFFDESGELKYPISLTEGSYSKLKELYKKCFRYATESIVSSLYPLPNLTQRVTYMDMDKYNILCRVQTLFDLSNLDESFNKRTFCGFSILTQDNFSHYPGAIIHGYYSKVTADLIAHIYPTDSLSSSWAKYRKDLTKKPNMLLDIDDLNALTYAYKTYCQLCLRTKTRENDILQQDAIICCGDVDEKSIKYAEENNKKVLVLKRNENIIEYNDDIYSHLH